MALKIVSAAGFAFLVVALRAVPTVAITQPAAWARDEREPMCIYDGLLALPPGTTDAENDARSRTVREGCMQRFGWTEGQVLRGMLVTRIMLDMMVARHEAVSAGVDERLMDTIVASFSSDDVASLGVPGQAVTPRAREVLGQLLPRRIAEHGLRGAAASKVSRAIMLEMMATNIIADFARR
jgi:hypothetical protein